MGQGTLFEDGGIKSQKVGPWNVYRVGKGLCAEMAFPDSYHVLQVSDLDTFADQESFVAALSIPEVKGNQIHGETIDGDLIAVNLEEMSISINGKPRPHPPKMLHDSPYMKSEYDSGKITIATKAGSVTFDGTEVRPEPPEMPDLAEGRSRWGNPVSEGGVTKVAHTRALGGLSPDRKGMVLKSVSIFVPHNQGGQIRLAVYAGGSLEDGPHAGTPARLLCDFGKTDKEGTGWLKLEHPAGGVPLPAATPIWIGWKGTGEKVHLKFQDGTVSTTGFQSGHGRWESKVIQSDPDKPWPGAWPADEDGKFEDFWYSCYLEFQVEDGE